MKLLITLVFLGFIHCSIATTYYINPNGSDETGNGSIGRPWKTLFKATGAVTTAGDIIHVTAGTYMEPASSILATGVSIEGDGATSIIKAAISEHFVAIIIARSAEATDGNQHISNIKLDGNKRITSYGIEIRGRKNFSIHDCIITDFDDTGIFWGGRNDNETIAPTNYPTGNSFYNNTVTNCAKYDGFGRGCLSIGGQDGMLIYNNTISQTGRLPGTNGWPIKYANDGYLKGVKIYNNKIIKEAFDGITWDFALELFNVSGLEIYNNRIIGSLDFNYQMKGNYPYSVFIHDNIIGPNALRPELENGIILEFNTEAAIIQKNEFKNLGVDIYFTPRMGSIINDITVKDNLCENTGVTGGSHQGFAIRFGSVEKGAYAIQNFLVEGNKFYASEKEQPFWGIGIMDVTKAGNFIIRNNTIKGFSAGSITADPGSGIDTMIVENNIFSGNGFANKPSFSSGGPHHLIYKNNTENGGRIFSYPNLKMNIIRPLYYAVKGTSMLEFIMFIAIIAGIWFCRKENIYVYPIALISILAFLFSAIDDQLWGNTAVAVYFIALSIYGWKLWAKRDRRNHRVVRITASTKKEYQMQLAWFAGSFIMLYAAMYKFKNSFSPGMIGWADAFVAACAFTGMWTMTRKKVQSWYWWIAASLCSIPLYFAKYYILYSMYYFAVLAVAYWALQRWKRKIILRRKS